VGAKLATEEELRIALEKAFDYRGDVTLTLKDNSRIEVTCSIGDRPSLTTSFCESLPKDSTQKLRIAYADITALGFHWPGHRGGKSWEAWVGKYWEKRLRVR